MTRERARAIVHRLAGLPPWTTITDEVLDAFIEKLREAAQTKEVTKGVIQKIVGKYVNGTGTYKTSGEDMSDINALLVAIQNPRPGGGSTTRK